MSNSAVRLSYRIARFARTCASLLSLLKNRERNFRLSRLRNFLVLRSSRFCQSRLNIINVQRKDQFSAAERTTRLEDFHFLRMILFFFFFFIITRWIENNHLTPRLRYYSLNYCSILSGYIHSTARSAKLSLYE